MRTRFDQFAKQVTQVAFAAWGVVHTDEEVSPETGRIDVWFTPRDPTSESGPTELGMLGRIGRSAFTMEAFHQSPDATLVMDCVCKHHAFRKLCVRRAPAVPRPIQWIVSAGKPIGALEGLACVPCAEWGQGVYDMPRLLYTRVIVVSELPRTRDTLILRLMGAGAVLKDAVAELRNLEENAPERGLSLPLLLKLRIEIEQKPQKTRDEEELLMNAQEIIDAYKAEMEQHRRKARAEGLVEGRAEGRIESILRVYTRRFAPPPADVADRIAHMHDLVTLDEWLDLATFGSADDLPRAVRDLPTP